MKCPYCGADMIAGDIEVRSSWASFLVWGLQFEKLVFKAGDRSTDVLEHRQKRAAFCCRSCKAVVIAGAPPREEGKVAPDPWGDDPGR